jgi:hypothetical protein
MSVFLVLEASQPCGSHYRLVVGGYIPPRVASMIMLLLRLF